MILTTIQTLVRIGAGALGAGTQRMATVQHNIANAHTPGYRRQRADLHTLGGHHQTQAFGVGVGDRRAIDAPLTDRLIPGYRGARGQQQALVHTAGLVEQMRAGGGGDLGEEVQAFFGTARALEASPNDRALRQAMLDGAERLAHRVRQDHDTLAQVRAESAHHAQALVGAINQDLQALAQADKALLADPQNLDLRDARDGRVGQLAEKIGVHPVRTDDGSLHLATAGGAALLEAGRAHPVTLKDGPPMQVHTARGVALGEVGGELGGTIQAHQEVLGQAMAQLEAFALEFGTAANAIHQAAAGGDGVTGRRLFDLDPADPARAFRLAAELQGRPDRLALSASGTGAPDALRQMLALDEAGGMSSGERFGDFVVGIDTGIGRAIKQAQERFELADGALFGAQAMQASISGVSLEEEMVALTQAKQAFEASSRLVQVGQELMDTILSLR